MKLFSLLLLPLALLSFTSNAKNISADAERVANYAVETYQLDMVESLRALVKHNTVAKEGTPSTENPVHIAFKEELKKQG